ncbi:hypothetical protein P43SY_000727 [Pythium insidiosum]|uniref:Uncharacterized protein n=1 Tax=Pythium insidiosum TaxID=114742 RepID=A0AAD5QEI9_PYTIN|nr:hypothetical protein P43SY_000727 [Pythium insidiosum]
MMLSESGVRRRSSSSGLDMENQLNQQLPLVGGRGRSWRGADDDDDKLRKMRSSGVPPPALSASIRARCGDNAFVRRVLMPIVRWWWPFTARKVARNLFVLAFTSLLVLWGMEILGRFRFHGYLSAEEDGNGLMGFYHEMDIDMAALRRASLNQESMMYQAGNMNPREVKAWVVERRRRTNGRKYLVGCTADWRGYVLRSFLHLFEDLKTRHGWNDLVTNDPLDFFYQQDKDRAPSVLFFCLNSFKYPYYLFLEHNKYFQELRALGTLIVVWSDDLQYYDQFNPIVVREKILKRADVLVGSYTYLTDDYFASVTHDMNARDLPLMLWLPHSAGPEFTAAPFNTHPIDKILLSGSIGSNYYPLRHWIARFQKDHTGMMDHYQHSGYYVPDNQSSIYASYLRSYRVGITTTLLHQYMVAKIFEIPSTGALLLVNKDLVPVMDAIGIRENEHFLTFDRRDPVPMMWWVVDPLNRATVDEVRKRGMERVREAHTVQQRVQALDQFFTDGTVTYSFPAELRVTSPCPMIAMASETQCENRFQWNARHKCDVWFCGARSLVAT